MTRILNSIRFDVMSQFRNGIYFVYVIVSAIYILAFRLVPSRIKDIVSILVLFSDPSVIGFFFIGGIILLERTQKTMENLFVTPLSISEYIISKTVSLSLVTVCASFVIIFFTYGLSFNPLFLLSGVLLSSILFTLLGLVAAVRVKTLNGYLWLSPFYIIILFVPVLEYLGIYKTTLFYFIPGKASLVLIEAAFRDVALWQLIYAVLMLVLCAAVAYIWSCKAFYKHIFLKIGSGGR